MKPSDTTLLRMYYRDDWIPEKISTEFKTFGDIANIIFINTNIKKIGIFSELFNTIIIFCDELDQEILGQIKERSSFTINVQHFKCDWNYGNSQTDS